MNIFTSKKTIAGIIVTSVVSLTCGIIAGYKKGYSKGYEEGYDKASESFTTEVTKKFMTGEWTVAHPVNEETKEYESNESTGCTEEVQPEQKEEINPTECPDYEEETEAIEEDPEAWMKDDNNKRHFVAEDEVCKYTDKNLTFGYCIEKLYLYPQDEDECCWLIPDWDYEDKWDNVDAELQLGENIETIVNRWLTSGSVDLYYVNHESMVVYQVCVNSGKRAGYIDIDDNELEAVLPELV